MQFNGRLSSYGNEVVEDEEKLVEDNVFPDFKGKNSLDLKKYLYETGLQNIFNDYQRNIANLDRAKQKEVQDAYYTRQLSQKYLGEYASNQGIGDVSGNLLNIYGQYQDNINQINENFEELNLGLEDKYIDKKGQYELGLMETEMQIEDVARQEQLEKDLSEIRYNLQTGVIPEGMDTQGYLDSVRDKIGEQAYWELSAENKLVEMNDTVNIELGKTNDFESQEDWDSHIDSLLKDGKINQKQSEYMKSMYIVEQSTNFDRLVGNDIDYSYFNPDMNLVEKGQVYESRDKSYILGETNTIVDESTSLYGELYEKGKDVGYNTPFAHNGKWFVKEIRNSEQVFVEYAKIKGANQATDFDKISGKEEGQKEIYNTIDKELGKKDGIIRTDGGMKSYKYDSETDTYTAYLDFDTLTVGGEKGDYRINGATYTIDKKYGQNTHGGIVDLKNAWRKGDWKNSYKDKKGVKPIVDIFIKEYFGGEKSKFSDYVEKRSSGKSRDTVAIVEYNGQYYTINDGELWQLKKK